MKKKNVKKNYNSINIPIFGAKYTNQNKLNNKITTFITNLSQSS